MEFYFPFFQLKNVKGQLDLTPPKNNMHLQIQLNKLHVSMGEAGDYG